MFQRSDAAESPSAFARLSRNVGAASLGWERCFLLIPAVTIFLISPPSLFLLAAKQTLRTVSTVCQASPDGPLWKPGRYSRSAPRQLDIFISVRSCRPQRFSRSKNPEIQYVEPSIFLIFFFHLFE